jgi:hypothetical protein
MDKKKIFSLFKSVIMIGTLSAIPILIGVPVLLVIPAAFIVVAVLKSMSERPKPKKPLPQSTTQTLQFDEICERVALKKSMPSNRLLLVFALCLCFVLFSHYFVHSFPDSASSVVNIKRSKRSASVLAEGVFRPGGFIILRIDPEIRSVGGYHQTTVSFSSSPVLFSNYAKVYGQPWDSKIEVHGDGPTKSTSKIAIEEIIRIPDEDSLVGKDIRLDFNVDMIYPALASYMGMPSFRDNRTNFEIPLAISLGNGLAPWYRKLQYHIRDSSHFGYVDTVLGILEILSIVFLISILWRRYNLWISS